MAGLVAHIRQLLAARAEHRTLFQAQVRSLSDLTLLWYLGILIEAWAAAVAFWRVAPLGMTLAPAILLTIAAPLRYLHWRWLPVEEFSARRAARELLLAAMVSAVVCLLLYLWGIGLYLHAGPVRQMVVLLLLVIGSLSATVAMTHAPLGVLSVTSISCLALIGFFATRGSLVLGATALTAAAVIVLATIIELVVFGHFVRMVEARTRGERLAEENRRLADHDSLTGLPNRRAFLDRLGQAHRTAAERRTRVAVITCDLVRFKAVNDLFGYETGDDLLREVGARLSAALDGTFLARLDSDRFACIIEDPDDDATAQALARRASAGLAEPFALPRGTVSVSARSGIAVFPTAARNPQELFEYAVHALQRAKSNDTSAPVMFTREHVHELTERASIEIELRRADRAAEFTVQFQPIVDSQRNAVVALEALGRWSSPTLGPVPPGRFIPIAESLGIIGELTDHLLRCALASARSWPASVRLAVNLSVHDLSSPGRVDQLAAIVSDAGFDPRRVDFEITETALEHDFERFAHSCRRVHQQGFGLALDDFGTGYSNLERVLALPLTHLKIDRRFVAGLERRPASRNIVRSLLGLARDLGLSAVIEGVETDAELAAVNALGGRLIQGYCYSRPVGAEGITALLNAHPPIPAVGG